MSIPRETTPITVSAAKIGIGECSSRKSALMMPASARRARPTSPALTIVTMTMTRIPLRSADRETGSAVSMGQG